MTLVEKEEPAIRSTTYMLWLETEYCRNNDCSTCISLLLSINTPSVITRRGREETKICLPVVAGT